MFRTLKSFQFARTQLIQILQLFKSYKCTLVFSRNDVLHTLESFFSLRTLNHTLKSFLSLRALNHTLESSLSLRTLDVQRSTSIRISS